MFALRSFQVDDKESASPEELTVDFGQLKVADESYLLYPNTVSSSGNRNGVAASCSRSREALNGFLKQCQIQPLGKPSFDWDKASKRTQRFAQRTIEIVSSVVKVPHLWNAIQSSRIVNQQLGIPHEYLPVEKGYLEALAEAYKNSTS